MHGYINLNICKIMYHADNVYRCERKTQCGRPQHVECGYSAFVFSWWSSTFTSIPRGAYEQNSQHAAVYAAVRAIGAPCRKLVECGQLWRVRNAGDLLGPYLSMRDDLSGSEL